MRGGGEEEDEGFEHRDSGWVSGNIYKRRREGGRGNET